MKGTELDRITRKADDIIEGSVAESTRAHDELELYYLLGGQDAIGTIADNLQSVLVANYQRIRDERLYLAAGFERFDDFMDNHPKSKLSYKRFNYIENIVKDLGPATFDLMSGSGLSMRQMKMLGKGTVRVEGDVVVVTTDTGREEIMISNRREWMDVVRTVVKANAEKDDKIARQKKILDEKDGTIRSAHDDLDRERARKSVEVSGDQHSMALAAVIGAFKNLRDEVAGLSEIDRGARKDNVLELLAGQMQLTAEAYGSADWARHAPRAERTPTGDPEADYVEDLLDRVLDGDLGDDDNEAELAAAMSH